MNLPVREPKDHEGDTGRYTNAADYLKLIPSLMMNHGKLLQADTVDEILKPQLDTAKCLADALAKPEIARYTVPGLPVRMK